MDEEKLVGTELLYNLGVIFSIKCTLIAGWINWDFEKRKDGAFEGFDGKYTAH
jgi:hypothetical protein